jgi:hypothetical protein
MTSIDKVSVAMSEWGFNVAKSVLPKINIPAESAIGKFMYGILGVNPASYNVWSELGFLAEPMIQSLVSPMVGRLMKGIPEEQVKDIAMKFADAFVKQAREKGSVNLFGLEMGENAFADLRAILASKFEDDEGVDGKV